MTGAERGGVPRRRGRNASAAPSSAATRQRDAAPATTIAACDFENVRDVAAVNSARQSLFVHQRRSAASGVGVGAQRQAVGDLLA